MTVPELLREFGRRMVLVTVDAGQIRVQGQAGNLDPEFRAAILARKGELLAILPGICGGCSQGREPDPQTAERCGWPGCGHKGVTK